MQQNNQTQANNKSVVGIESLSKKLGSFQALKNLDLEVYPRKTLSSQEKNCRKEFRTGFQMLLRY